MYAHKNLDLKVRGSEAAGYTVEATGPAGERASGALDTARLADRTADLAAVRDRQAGPEVLDRTGTALFEALFPREVLRVYDRVRPDADDDNGDGPDRRGLRLRLHLPPELAPLPWELLCDQGTFLALDPRCPVIRYLDLPDPPATLATRPPLRLLHLVANPVDARPLDADREARLLGEALAPLQARGLVEILPGTPGSLQTLRQARRRGCHVLHFSGHGGFEDGKGYLLFEDDDGRQRRVDGDSLAHLLLGSDVRLAVLNACQTAQAGAGDAFSSVAGALVQAGLPAVIAFLQPVSDGSARLFAAEFYRALADGLGVEAAVCDGRRAILVEGDGAAGECAEWATPVLYLRAADGRILRLEEGAVDDGGYGDNDGPGSGRMDGAVIQENRVTIDTVNGGEINIGAIHVPVQTAPAARLPDLVRELDQRVCALAPREKQGLARAQVSRLEQALSGEHPDLRTVARVWRWFERELLPLSGAVLSVLAWAEPLLSGAEEGGGEQVRALLAGL